MVTKTLPIFTPYIQSAIDAIAGNRSGVVFSKKDSSSGKEETMVESQVVAEIVRSLRDMAQVMIGEAIAVEELASFLNYRYPDESAPSGH